MTLRLVVSLVLLAGLGLFFYSLVLPYYTDQQAFDALRNGYTSLNHTDYYAKEAALKTHKIVCMDAGAGVAVAMATVLLFLSISGIRTVADCKWITSFTRKKLIIASNLMWLLMVPGTDWYYVFRLESGDYPPFADSIAIPEAAKISVYLFALLPLNLFLLLTTTKARLPTRIFLKATRYGKAAVGWEIFFGTLLLLNGACLVAFVLDGDHVFILVNLFFTYVLLTLRAGHISQWVGGGPLTGEGATILG